MAPPTPDLGVDGCIHIDETTNISSVKKDGDWTFLADHSAMVEAHRKAVPVPKSMRLKNFMPVSANLGPMKWAQKNLHMHPEPLDACKLMPHQRAMLDAMLRKR